jgi:hypothetical protein
VALRHSSWAVVDAAEELIGLRLETFGQGLRELVLPLA